MRALRYFVARRLLPQMRKYIVRSRGLPGWIQLFDLFVASANPNVDRSVRTILPRLLEFESTHGSATLLLSGTGMLVALSPQQCLYMPLGTLSEMSLRNSHAVHSSLSLCTSAEMTELVDYNFSLLSNDGLLSANMPRFAQIGIYDMAGARNKVVSVLRRTVTRGSVDREIRENVLSAMNELLGQRSPLNGKANYLLSREWTLSAAHGDFTPGNLMLDGEHVRLIDLDRFQRVFPAVYDPMHFAIEGRAKNRRCAWLEILDDAEEKASLWSELQTEINTVEPDVEAECLWDLYVFLRIGLEYRRDNTMPSRWSLRVRCYLQGLIGQDRGTSVTHSA